MTPEIDNPGSPPHQKPSRLFSDDFLLAHSGVKLTYYTTALDAFFKSTNMAADFEKQSYWKNRFTTETAFEWLLSSKDFIALIQPHIFHLPPTSRILHLGSGTSDLHNHFREGGFLDVTNLDYEPLAVERGRALEKERFEDVRMKYVVGDATKLREEVGFEGLFELIVDKSTVDAISCGGDEALMRMAGGIKQCLAEGGIWISLSFSSQRFHISNLPFDVKAIAQVPTPKLKPTDPDIFHWCYLLRPR